MRSPPRKEPYSMAILPENRLNNLFENLVTQFVKDNLESIIKAEIQQFMTSEEAGNHNSRNGYYIRNLHTKYGNVEDLEVPRDRQGLFLTQLFEPYQRRDGWLEEAVTVRSLAFT